ncbi:ATP-dependent helicase, partial [Lactobacillus amylovorus]
DSSVDQEGNTNEFLKMAYKFINVNDLDINLIQSINPFQRAYDVMSQHIDSNTLRIIECSLDAKKYDFSDEELMQPLMDAKVLVEQTGRRPHQTPNHEEE